MGGPTDMLDDLSFAGLKMDGKVGKSTIRPTQDLIWVGMRWLARLAQIKVPTRRSCNRFDTASASCFNGPGRR
jgi:hypothetical protein